MADHEQKHEDLQGHALDLELDAALAKYAAAEPRAGIEERVLANLWAEREPLAQRASWGWPAMAVLLAVAVAAAVLLARRLEKPAPDFAALHSSTAKPLPVAGNRLPNTAGRTLARPLRKRALNALRVQTAASAEPRLDQFPSPAPLSEQEKMLEDYVTEHRRQAIFVARARMAALKKDLAEEAEAGAAGSAALSDQSSNQQTNR